MTTEQLTEPPVAGTETETLLGALERIRRTFAWKCADLDATAMTKTVGTSNLTLGGLIRHLSRVEDDSFGWKLHDLPREGSPQAWDEDFVWGGDEDVDAVWANWREAVDRSRARVAEALADGGLDRAKGVAFQGWGTPSLRRIVVDMIEEYARHTGHADLIREAIDGRVGEDAPS